MENIQRYPTVSIIIVSYNTREMTLDCIRSVFSDTKKVSFQVIVFDNASDDNSCDAVLREFGDDIILISSPINVGFAKANNQAAIAATGAFFLLLNPDTVVIDGAIDRLVEFVETCPDADIWGGRTLFADHMLNPASCWSKQTLWSLFSQGVGLSSIFRRSSFFNPEGMGGWNREGEREVDIVSGCFLLIRRELWNKLCGFDPEFFMYGEDADLCLRATSVGARPVVTSEATIIHYGGASEKIRSDKMVKLLRAKNLLILRHFNKRIIGLGTLLLAAWPFSRWIFFSVLSFLRRKTLNDSATAWRETWQRRSEWKLF